MDNPSVTIALALMAGVVAQVLARSLKLPAIVLLLALGVALGPEFANVVRPSTLHDALFALVGFAVAVILFEGGMNLQIRRMRRENRAIRQLITVGALVTMMGATISARYLLGWSWSLSGLFGSLVIVTGPTVIGPMLRRLRVESATSTILEAEGVFIDAIGAILATIALDVALHPTSEGMLQAVWHGVQGLGMGSAIGAGAGLALGFLMRLRWVIPEGLENIFTLAFVLSLFHLANAIVPESGVAAVTMAGVAVGNIHSHVLKSLHTFKEELTALLIGMLFVLLAADVELANVHALGTPGLLVVASLILVVRPLNVLVGTFGSGLNWRQKSFLAWIGPRGIVAAAIASLFAVELERNGIEGGRQLRALVFLVIGATVLLAGATGGIVSRLLGLRRPSDDGFVILGANELARAVGKALANWRQDVVLVDTNPHHCTDAERDGLRVIHGNGLEPRTLHRASIDTRAGALGLSTNSTVNLHFARQAKAEGKLARHFAGVGRSHAGFNTKTALEQDTRLAFGQPIDMEHWVVRLRRGDATTHVFEWTGGNAGAPVEQPLRGLDEKGAVPVLYKRRDVVRPIAEDSELKKGDQVVMLIDRARKTEIEHHLDALGWRRMSPSDPPPTLAS